MKSSEKNKGQKKPPSKKLKWEETVVYDNFTTCDHYFEFHGTDCVCKKCGTGLIGVLRIEDGKPIL